MGRVTHKGQRTIGHAHMCSRCAHTQWRSIEIKLDGAKSEGGEAWIWWSVGSDTLTSWKRWWSSRLSKWAASLPLPSTRVQISRHGVCAGCFGNVAVINTCLQSFVTDRSDDRDKTQRISHLLAMSFNGFFVGSLVSNSRIHFKDFPWPDCIALLFGI